MANGSAGAPVTVGELGEHPLLARILARLPRPSSSILLGPGDDAAVLAPVRNEQLVVTTDAVVEGVHFTRAFSSAADIGHKALAVNLSDLAAMGATPRWALLSLVLPDASLVDDIEALVEAFAALAARYQVSVVGGNITRTDGPLVVDVTVGGGVRPRRWLTRNGARPGDEVWVSGSIGGAAAGLEMMNREPGAGNREPQTRNEEPGTGHREPGTGNRESGTENSESANGDALPAPGARLPDRGDALTAPGSRFPAPGDAFPAAGSPLPDPGCIARHRRPEARVRLGVAVARARAATAAMDLSDGLADALHQVGDASSVGMRIDTEALPIDPAARDWWAACGIDPVLAALSGGDDYELLLTAPARRGGALRSVIRRMAEPPLTRIGVVTKDPAERVLLRGSKEEPIPKGFEHFAHR